MRAPSCKTCAWCIPASDPEAAKSYVQCIAPYDISALPIPTNGDQRMVFRDALFVAKREPRNWTTIAHVEGRLAHTHVAGWNCPLWKDREQ